MNYEMMNGMGFMGGWGGMLFGGLMMVLFFALIVGLIVLVFRWIGGTSGPVVGRDALEILRQRFAHGEIDTEEFEKRSRQLRTAE